MDILSQPKREPVGTLEVWAPAFSLEESQKDAPGALSYNPTMVLKVSQTMVQQFIAHTKAEAQRVVDTLARAGVPEGVRFVWLHEPVQLLPTNIPATGDGAFQFPER